MRPLPLIAATAFTVLASATLVAQPAPETPGKPDAANVVSGDYAVDPGHTQILFAYGHMGFTTNMGLISGSTGSLTIDKEHPEMSKVDISVPIANIETGIVKLDEHMKSPDMFDAAKFATASFKSTSVKVDGMTAEITGDLTIKGVTKPVTLDAELTGAGPHPMSKKVNIGFAATTHIKRSEFGLGFAVPIVADDVELKIAAAFEKQ